MLHTLSRRWYCYSVQKEREFYEVTIENRKMMYKVSRRIIDTSEGPKNAKWIFVLSTTRVLYIGTVRDWWHLSLVSSIPLVPEPSNLTETDEIRTLLQKSKGTFQHSSFLAGGATSAAGRLVVENGILKVSGSADF